MHALTFSRVGGPGVLEWSRLPDPQVLSGDVDGRFQVGQRVAFADSPFANAELVAVELSHLIALPDDISPAQAAERLIGVLDGLEIGQTGTFWHSNGSVLPW